MSFAYYTSAPEFEFILAAIEFIAVYGQRFLPLYSFNWKTGEWKFRQSAARKIVGEDAMLILELAKLGIHGDVSTNIERCDSSPHEEGGAFETKYTKYLEAASNIARLLPEFPSSRQVPNRVDLELVHFRI